jgi:diaminopimelate epimerase
VREKKLTTKRVIRVETAAGVIELRMKNRQDVEVDMGEPVFEPADIPFTAPRRADHYRLTTPRGDLEIGALSMGNPHAIIRVDSTDAADIEGLGPVVESHPDFPQRVNAGFMQLLSETEINLRVYERGVGETLACGTGACAAVVYGLSRRWLRDTVTVNLPGGKLSISWAGEGRPVIMTGPTAVVFEGTIRI